MKVALLSADEKSTTARHFDDVCKDGVKIKLYTNQNNIDLNNYELIIWVDPCNFLPVNIEKFKGLKIGYFIDTHRSLFKRKIMARCFDIIFVAQKNAVHQFEGVRNVFWLPLAYNDKYYKENNKRKYDVSFIGNTNHKNSNRGKDLEKILRDFSHPKTNGYHFTNMLKIYSESKIVLNITIGGELNMRFFEGIGSGAVLLTDQKNEFVGNLFKSGKDFINFHNADDAIRKIRKILLNYEAYSINARKAQKKVLLSHTYKHRFEEILRKIKQIYPEKITAFEVGLFYLAANNLKEFRTGSCLSKIWKYMLIFFNNFRRLRSILIQ